MTEIKFDFFDFAEIWREQNPKIWEHDRSLTVGASEAFACQRQTFYKKNGVAADEDYVEDWGAMERGNIIEDHFFVPILKAGVKKKFPKAKIYGAGKIQTTLVHENNSATPDGLVVGVPRDCLAHLGVEDIGQCPSCPKGFGSIVVEAKSIDPRVNLQEEKAVHHGQTQVQLGMIREQTDFEPNYGLVVYIDASFFSQIEQFPVEFDAKTWQIGQDRAADVFGADNATDLVPEGRFMGTCQYCQFQTRCRADTLGAFPDDNKPEDVPPEDHEKIQEAVLLERELALEHKAIEKEHDEAKENLKHLLQESSVRRDKGDGWSVSYIQQAGRKTISKEKLIEAGLNPDDYTVEGASFTKLQVRKK